MSWIFQTPLQLAMLRPLMMIWVKRKSRVRRRVTLLPERLMVRPTLLETSLQSRLTRLDMVASTDHSHWRLHTLQLSASKASSPVAT